MLDIECFPARDTDDII